MLPTTVSKHNHQQKQQQHVHGTGELQQAPVYKVPINIINNGNSSNSSTSDYTTVTVRSAYNDALSLSAKYAATQDYNQLPPWPEGNPTTKIHHPQHQHQHQHPQKNQSQSRKRYHAVLSLAARLVVFAGLITYCIWLVQPKMSTTPILERDTNIALRVACNVNVSHMNDNIDNGDSNSSSSGVGRNNRNGGVVGSYAGGGGGGGGKDPEFAAESQLRVGIFVAYGQSNSDCFGELGYRTQHPARVLQYYNHQTYELTEPGMLGATGRAGCAWSRLGDRLINDPNNNYNAVIFATCGVGGAAIHELVPGATTYSTLTRPYDHLVQTIHELQEQYGHVDGILYHQGESNNADGDPSLYSKHLRFLAQSLSEDVGGDGSSIGDSGGGGGGGGGGSGGGASGDDGSGASASTSAVFANTTNCNPDAHGTIAMYVSQATICGGDADSELAHEQHVVGRIGSSSAGGWMAAAGVNTGLMTGRGGGDRGKGLESALVIRPGPNTDSLGFEYRHDQCHFNMQGLDNVARLWHDALSATALHYTA